MEANPDLANTGVEWLRWVLDGMGALGLLLIGWVYQHGDKISSEAWTAAQAAKELALASKEAAKTAAIEATEALRRETLATINTLAQNVAGSQERVSRRFDSVAKDIADTRVDTERRFSTRDDFKELRDELQGNLTVQLAAMEHRLDNRFKEIADTLRLLHKGHN